jgi:hypothetical protein
VNSAFSIQGLHLALPKDRVNQPAPIFPQSPGIILSCANPFEVSVPLRLPFHCESIFTKLLNYNFAVVRESKITSSLASSSVILIHLFSQQLVVTKATR